MALKKELRKKYLEKRGQLSSTAVTQLSSQIFENFKLQFPLQEGDKVHIFLCIPKFNEVDTSHFIEYFKLMKAKIFVPKIADQKMIAVELTEATEMESSSWGIIEPIENIDAAVSDYRYVITPLLYCDAAGNRVGYGKGYYDNFFSSLNDQVQKIGVSFFSPDESIDDVNNDDVPLDYLVLPDKILSFKGLL